MVVPRAARHVGQQAVGACRGEEDLHRPAGQEVGGAAGDDEGLHTLGGAADTAQHLHQVPQLGEDEASVLTRLLLL